MINRIPGAHWEHDDSQHETELERLDRNFGEILQEIRVAQTGTQILFAFLLTLVFMEKFDRLTTFQTYLYLVTLSLAFVATGFLIGPVAFHRLTFRRHMRLQLVKTANVLSIAGLVFLAFALTSSVFLVVDVALGNVVAGWLTGIAFMWLIVLWFILPILQMLRKSSSE